MDHWTDLAREALKSAEKYDTSAIVYALLAIAAAIAEK